MLTTLIGLTLAATPVEAKIVTASMFKNGFSIVTREFSAPGPGEYTIAQIPQGSLGTLWLTTTVGTKLESVVTAAVEREVKSSVGTIDGILRANVGKVLHLGIREGDAIVTNQVTGTLLSADGEVVILKGEKGTLVLNKGQITSVSLPSGDLVITQTSKAVDRGLKFTVTGDPGKVVMISLERGLTWAPGYAVDITDRKTLSLVAKSTVLNDLGNLQNAEARFITGFPNVPYADYLDPLVSGQNVQGFLSMISTIGGPGGALGPAGPGGGGMRGGDMMRQNAMSAADLNNFGDAMANNPLGGEMKQDLFFYRQPNVTLEKGEKGYFTMFRTEAAYEDVYSWDSEDPRDGDPYAFRGTPSGPADIWHLLLFKNTSNQPFTTGAATIFQGGEIVGQDLMKYVPVGGNVELIINKSLDVRATVEEAEISREKGAVKDKDGNPVFDRVIIQGTMTMTNAKPEAIKMRIRKTLTGDIVGADGSPEVTRTALAVAATNPISKLAWMHSVPARSTSTLKYSYKLFVRSAR